MDNKQIWFGMLEPCGKAVLEKVLNLNYSHIFLPYSKKELLKECNLPRRMKIAYAVDNESELRSCLEEYAHSDRLEILFTRDTGLIMPIRQAQKKAGLIIHINDRAALDDAVKKTAMCDFLVADFMDPTNIPLELILAESWQGARIFKRVRRADDGIVSFQTMEKGSDGILLESTDLNEIIKLDKAFAENEIIPFALQEAIVTDIQHAGLGERVCIDTTSELFQDEGMILGSTSNGGIFICSETHYLPYMDLRPFRVNAGGLHLYTWGINNRTHYLSDLKANDRILIVNSKGKARKVTIGRLKIERRPLLYIQAAIEGIKINTFIQDDWHVRVMGAKGEIRPSSELKTGDKLLGMLDTPGRHVGIKIDESIREV